jgi:four helix bundle protein
MTADEMKTRTKQFALRAMKLCDARPNTRSANTVANQWIRSATSVGANYGAACRARSDADFANRIGVVLEEVEESQYWLEINGESGIKSQDQISELLKESKELIAIFVASSNTARKRLTKPRNQYI